MGKLTIKRVLDMIMAVHQSWSHHDFKVDYDRSEYQTGEDGNCGAMNTN